MFKIYFAFLSYVNSFSLLQQETQIEYLHLTHTNHLQRPLKIYDKIGIGHSINLDSTSFLIQKKTDLLYPTLASLIQKNELGLAKELLEKFVQLGFHLIKQEIESPITLQKNIGCLGSKPIQIDVGKVFKKENASQSSSPRKEIRSYTRGMKE